jgi:O-antigen/teichoic acid export membrane protein
VDNVLGPDWQGTAAIIRVLALASIADLLGSTITPILQGLGRPDRILVIEAVQSAILVALAWLLAGEYGVVGAAMAWLPAVGTAQIVGILFLRRLLPRPFAGLVMPLGAVAVVSGVAAVIALGVDRLLPGVSGLVLAGLAAIILIAFLLWILERRFALGISDGLVRAFPRAAALVGFSSP